MLETLDNVVVTDHEIHIGNNGVNIESRNIFNLIELHKLGSDLIKRVIEGHLGITTELISFLDKLEFDTLESLARFQEIVRVLVKYSGDGIAFYNYKGEAHLTLEGIDTAVNPSDTGGSYLAIFSVGYKDIKHNLDKFQQTITDVTNVYPSTQSIAVIMHDYYEYCAFNNKRVGKDDIIKHVVLKQLISDLDALKYK